MEQIYQLSSDQKTWPILNGVYAIRCKPTGITYIGKTEQAQGFRKRIRNHRRTLRRNEHANPILQNAYNKYGEENFEFYILEPCSIDLPKRENFWIEKFLLDGKELYNVVLFSEEKKITNKKIPFKVYNPDGILVEGDDLKKFCKEMGFERQNMLNLLRGGAKSVCGGYTLDGTVRKIYRIIDPEGKGHQFSEINPFAREHGLPMGSLNQVLKGEIVQTNGWHLENQRKNKSEIFYALITPDNQLITGWGYSKIAEEIGITGKTIGKLMGRSVKTSNGYRAAYVWSDYDAPADHNLHELVSLNNETIVFSNVAEFCRNHQLSIGATHSVLNGKAAHNKGWHLPNPTPRVIELLNNYKSRRIDYHLVSPNQEIFTFTNIADFCRIHKIDTHQVRDVLNSKCAHHKGWTLPKPDPKFLKIIEKYQARETKLVDLIN